MAAERRDHDRGARLRRRLAAATATGQARRAAAVQATVRPTTPPGGCSPIPLPAAPLIFGPRRIATTGSTTETTRRGSGAPERPTILHRPMPEPARAERARARAGNWSTATGAGRRARRLAAEAAAPAAWSDAPLPELGSAPPEPYGASATGRSESRGPGPNGAGQTGETVAAGSPGVPVSARDERRWDDALSSTARFAPMSDLPSRASEARDGAGGAAPDANWFADEATAGGAVPRREPPAVADPAEPGHEPGHGRAMVDREAGRVAHRGGQGEAPTGRATSATSRGGSAHTATGRAVAIGASSASGSLIGDALLRELLENGLPARRAEPSRVSGVSDTVVFELDPRYDSTVAGSPVLPVRDPARTPTRRGQESPHGAQEPGPQARLHRAGADWGQGRPPAGAAGRTATPGRRFRDGWPSGRHHESVLPSTPAPGRRARPRPPRAPHRTPLGPTSVGAAVCPGGRSGRFARGGHDRRRRSARHSAPHNGHGRPPGSNGSHRPEGPAADHGGNPGDSPDAGSPGARHTRPGRLLAPAGRGPIRHLRHRRPRPRRPAGRRARRLPRHLSHVDAQAWAGPPARVSGTSQGQVGHATGLPWSRQAG